MQIFKILPFRAFSIWKISLNKENFLFFVIYIFQINAELIADGVNFIDLALKIFIKKIFESQKGN